MKECKFVLMDRGLTYPVGECKKCGKFGRNIACISENETMTEEQKLIAEIATRLMVATIKNSGFSKDIFYSQVALKHAKNIVKGSKENG